MIRLLILLAILVVLSSALCAGDVPAPVQAFLAGGSASRHAKAPPEVDEFGRLVGLWRVDVEMARRDGGWAESAPGTWAFRYAIDGFAVSDLWYQGAEALPVYMAELGRDYLLTANRIYDVKQKTWQVAWMANGAGQAMGADFGTFTAKSEGDEVVMTSPAADDAPAQRVVFYEIGDDSFRWRSEYSRDEGKTWMTVMRMLAHRVESEE